MDERSKFVGEAATHHRSIVGEEMVSTTSEKAGNVFELFRTHDGEEFTVYAREDGKKFYVDFEEQVKIKNFIPMVLISCCCCCCCLFRNGATFPVPGTSEANSSQ